MATGIFLIGFTGGFFFGYATDNQRVTTNAAASIAFESKEKKGIGEWIKNTFTRNDL